MGIDFRVIWVSDFNNTIIVYARLPTRRPARRPKVTRRPPSQQNSKKMTDISLWVSIFGLFGSLISIIRLYFTSASPTAGQESPTARRHTKMLRR